LADGVSWAQIGTAQTLGIGPPALAGLAVTAHNNAALATALFESVSLLEDVGGIPASAPAVASWGPGRLDVFYLGHHRHPRPLMSWTNSPPVSMLG
jgi:hypothetical protein